MATVRMSRRLLSEIRSAARKKYVTVNPYKDFPSPDKWFNESIKSKMQSFVQKSIEHFGGDYIDFDRQAEVNNLVIKTTKIVQDDNGVEDHIKTTYQCSFDTYTTTPKFMMDGYSTITIKLPREHELVQQCEAVDKHNDACRTGEREYINKIEEAISDFSTLNQALKAWPALKDLVDDKYVQKVYEKVERKAKQQQQREAIAIQEQELNEVLLTANLLEN